MWKSIISWGGKLLRRTPRLFKGASTSRLGRTLEKVFSRPKAKLSTRIWKSSFGKGVSKTVEFLKTKWSGLPSWAQTSLKFAGEMVAFDTVWKFMNGDDEPEVTADNRESVDARLTRLAQSGAEITEQVLQLNGHYRLLDSLDSFSGSDSISEPATERGFDAINEILRSRRNIAGEMPVDRGYTKISAMAENERAFFISRLIATAKTLALASDFPETMLLLTRQFACSDMLNACPTAAFDHVMMNYDKGDDSIENSSAALNMMFSSLYDETAKAAMEDYFDAHSTVFDVFDLTSNNSYIDDTKDPDILHRVLVSKMSTDDSVGLDLSFFRKFITDSDGEDDESLIVRRLISYSKASPIFVDMFDNINDHDTVRISAALNRF